MQEDKKRNTTLRRTIFFMALGAMDLFGRAKYMRIDFGKSATFGKDSVILWILTAVMIAIITMGFMAISRVEGKSKESQLDAVRRFILSFGIIALISFAYPKTEAVLLSLRGVLLLNRLVITLPLLMLKWILIYGLVVFIQNIKRVDRELRYEKETAVQILRNLGVAIFGWAIVALCMALFIGTFIGNQQMAGMGLIEVVREAQKMKELAFFGKAFIYVMIPIILHFSFREEVGGI